MGLIVKIVDFVAENSTTILTVGAVIGVVGTGVTSWYAAKKTKEIREELEEEKGEDEEVTKAEVAKEAWPYYVAPVTLGALTITCIIVLNIEHDKKYAALLGAYTIAKTDKEKLSKKVNELVGEEKADQIKESLGIKKDIPEEEVDYTVEESKDPSKKEWFIDTETGVRFWASEHDIDVAANYIGDMVSGDGTPSLVDFYECLGVTDDMCPDVAQNIIWGIDQNVRVMKPKYGSVYDPVERKAYRSIMYAHNFVSDRYDC